VVKLLVQFKQADREFLLTIAEVEIPDLYAGMIAENRNTMLEHKFVLTLVSEVTVGELIIPVRGPR